MAFIYRTHTFGPLTSRLDEFHPLAQVARLWLVVETALMTMSTQRRKDL